MIAAILCLIFLVLCFFVTAGGQALRRLSGPRAERQMRKKLAASYRIYRAAFDLRGMTQGAILTAVVGLNCIRFVATVAGLFFLLSFDGWPLQGLAILQASGEIL